MTRPKTRLEALLAAGWTYEAGRMVITIRSPTGERSVEVLKLG